MKKTGEPKHQIRFEGELAGYMSWPIYLSVIVICFVTVLCLLYPETIPYAAIYGSIYIIICLVLFVFKRKNVISQLIAFSSGFSRAQHMLLKEIDVPLGILDLEGKLIWASNDLKDLIGTEKYLERNISEIFDNSELTVMPTIEEDVTAHFNYKNNDYFMKLRLITPSDYNDTVLWHDDLAIDVPDDSVVAMFLYNETEIVSLKKENYDEKMLVGLLYIDNYEEAFEGTEEAKRSLIMVWVEREINKHMRKYDAVIKKLEKDKFIFMFKQKYLSALEEDRFSILEDVRNLNVYDHTITISIGIGVNYDTYTKCYDMAHEAIGLALGRGGDQVVIKRDDGVTYYGGTSASREKQTRVKARVKAEALKEYIEGRENVVVMGHALADIDAVGAAVGIYRIAKSLQKRAYIVLSTITSSVAPFVDAFKADPEYEEDMFISGAKAKEIVNNDTLLVVVDVNKPGRTDTKELLELTKTIVVLDHHRQEEEKIDDAVLSYIEPYASSACEMVAEVIQYVGNDLKLRTLEAEAMYSGIKVDTNDFIINAGVRTFEAAAYLRRSGVDVPKIRKIFRSNIKECKARAEALSNAEIFRDSFAMAVLDGEGLDTPTEVAAQTANELLMIEGVKGSFVFSEFEGKVYISARSIDELNVQVIMEKIGGGGHQTAAGTQLENTTIQEAKETVKNLLEGMIENKEIKQ